MPEHPVAFMKPTTSIAHPGQSILLPEYRMNGPEVDYECELAVIIGRTARDVAEHEAIELRIRLYRSKRCHRAELGQVISNAWQSFDRFCPWAGAGHGGRDSVTQCLALRQR